MEKSHADKDILSQNMPASNSIEPTESDFDISNVSSNLDHFAHANSFFGGQTMHGWFGRFKNRTPRVLQLLLLYISLGILAGAGGIFFMKFEKQLEQDSLDYKLQIWTNITNEFNATELVEIRDWADNYAQIFTDANKWKLHYSVFFAATTFTTCGFGLQAPVTWFGRLMVVLYGLPAIMIYGVIAKKIGMLCVHFIEVWTKFLGVSSSTWRSHRLKFIGFYFLAGFFMMCGIILHTATDEGFGHGIYNYFHAIYFLYTTTMTIGYGDVMMSGSSKILTVLIGFWLASTLGLAICFAQELGAAAAGDDRGNSSANCDALHIINQDIKNRKLSVLNEAEEDNESQ